MSEEIEETENTDEITETAEADAPVSDTAEAVSDTETPVAQPEPKKKRKRLPRSERPQKTRPKRPVATARKAIVRLPKPEHERGRTQERRGIVVSSAMDKTIVVQVDAVQPHAEYKKVVRRTSRLKAHDENNEARIGDTVLVRECRPLSRDKTWRLIKVLQRAE